jgi:hypothetical protein
MSETTPTAPVITVDGTTVVFTVPGNDTIREQIVKTDGKEAFTLGTYDLNYLDAATNTAIQSVSMEAKRGRLL